MPPCRGTGGWQDAITLISRRQEYHEAISNPPRRRAALPECRWRASAVRLYSREQERKGLHVITRLTGKLVACDLTEAVVDVHGVGYAVTIPVSTYDKLPRVGAEVVLHTHLHVREDIMQLFGFGTEEERRVFRLLQTVNGVGPKLALNVLSCMPIQAFCQALLAGDLKALSRISGVGKRTAERLVVELKGRVAEIAPAAAFGAKTPGAKPASREAQDAVAALETLGFRGDLAQRTVLDLCAALPPGEHTAENLIRKALQRLNG